MRKMNENAATPDIRTRLCIKFLKIYLLYIKKKRKWKEILQCFTGNRRKENGNESL